MKHRLKLLWSKIPRPLKHHSVAFCFYATGIVQLAKYCDWTIFALSILLFAYILLDVSQSIMIKKLFKLYEEDDSDKPRGVFTGGPRFTRTK